MLRYDSNTQKELLLTCWNILLGKVSGRVTSEHTRFPNRSIAYNHALDISVICHFPFFDSKNSNYNLNVVLSPCGGTVLRETESV